MKLGARDLVYAVETLLLLALALWSGLDEWQRARMLLELRAHGEQVEAAAVTVHDSAVRRNFHVTVNYRFGLNEAQGEERASPVHPAHAERLRQGADLDAQATAQIARAERLMRGEPDGWISGQAQVAPTLAEAIQRMDGASRQVTYLPDRPHINTIGPITDGRIYWNWIGRWEIVLPFGAILLLGMWWVIGWARSVRAGDVSLRST